MASLSAILCPRIRRRRVAALSHKEPKVYSWEHIEKATRKFSVVIGYGGFSTVYLGGDAAVKAYSGSQYLYSIFKRELDVLLHVKHPNIVTLRGYCDDDEQGALVLDYFPNGTFADNRSLIPLDRRFAIAFQLALALDYLHERCIVHGDIKAANILLDHNFNCKLCDFGSAKTGLSSSARTSKQISLTMTNSPGYTDPHYLKTGIVSAKNDIYSYGVVLLELLTGREAFSNDANTPLRYAIVEKGSEEVEEALDPRVVRLLPLAQRCVHPSPHSRPSASQISASIFNFVPSVCHRHE